MAFAFLLGLIVLIFPMIFITFLLGMVMISDRKEGCSVAIVCSILSVAITCALVFSLVSPDKKSPGEIYGITITTSLFINFILISLFREDKKAENLQDGDHN
ncbi:hypothetical protein [Candidatus Uabimicrobium sp. HlEnr_7]|uniref:hypothetical protein n=1 Tax=Candidatus Uabimicrobium helgolandensis TaxID=3095367 RepID=UPI003558C7E7